ncbi:MAG TPA: Ig-like domain-containing protein, partial [Candidatus Limnocylindrales bacterium]|nr:Ig-like domain-containing protein [Candidatus Limnocylindrales bacterium]
VDYSPISNWVTIPAGATSNLIRIAPINPVQTNTQTVVLQLAPSPLMTPLNPVNYAIGVPSNAVVSIVSTNPPPPQPVIITSPTNGAVFYTPTNIPISAWMAPSAPFATNVEFFAGTNDLGKPNGGFGSGVVGETDFLTWTNPLPGDYALMAVATDYFGTSRTSAPVNITVLAGPPPPVPVVTIEATVPVAATYQTTNFNPFTPLAKLGVFTVFRHGNTNLTLNVYYQIGGTATNGVDYAQISNWVTIPAGATSNSIPILPLANRPSPGVTKTVVLQLAPSPLMSPINYEIGVPSNAVVSIVSTNPPPVTPVSIESPTEGTVFFTPTNIQISAWVVPFFKVEFFAGTNDLGRGFPGPQAGMSGGYYFLTWTNPPPGDYALTAVVSGTGGNSITSAPVNITVLPGIQPTNHPPVVRIISPANGSVFRAPIDIPLHAFGRDPDGSIASIEFFAGSNSLGFGKPVYPTPIAGQHFPPIIFPTNMFFLVWSNAPIGTYALTAKATDNDGASTISDSVKIAILPSPPPPTNRPPIVSIVANDPVAIEGTNCWVWPGETNSTPTWAAWPTAVRRFFTNSGPKTATFTVRRLGDTNGDLTLPYDIGGTASNGVDYVALPGSVTIPAGERRALITIVPIDDGPPDINKTVILALTASTNTSPDYVLGFTRRAAAIIIDSDGTRPATAMLSDKCFHLVAPGPDAAWFYIEYSTDMANWMPVCTNQVVNGSIDFVDPDAPDNSSRFYRAVPVTNAPAD